MSKILKVFNTIVLLLPYLIQIVELFKKNEENLFKKGDKEVIPPDREVDEAADPIEKKK